MRIVAFDLETRPFAAGCMAPRPIVISIACDGENRLSTDWRREALALLSEPQNLFVGHNVAYDMGCLYHHAPELRRLIWQAYDEGRVSDTGIRDRILLLAKGARTFDRVLSIRPVFSLAEAVLRNLPKESQPSWWLDEKKHSKKSPDDDDLLSSNQSTRTSYGFLENVALADWPEASVRYALEDSRLTFEVWKSQNRESAGYRESDFLVRNESDQVRAAWALHLISCWGLITDTQRVTEYEKLWDRLYDDIQEELAASGLIKASFSANRVKYTKDTKAIRKRVEDWYSSKGLKPPLTDSGQTSIDRETLEDTSDPALRLVADLSKIEKLKSTYLPVIQSGLKAPIHTRYEVLLETGRTSSSSPNLQNIPRDSYVRDRKNGVDRLPLTVREAFVPRLGYSYVSVDYDTLELRTLSQTCLWTIGKSELARALNAGLDPHLDLACVMLDMTYDKAKAALKEGDKHVKFYRSLAKAANFGYPGGSGADAFAAFAKMSSGGELKLSKQQSQDIKNYWVKKWPEMPDYFKFVDSQGRGGDRFAVKMFGSDLLRGDCTYTAACNCYFQGLAAHGAKRALYRVLRAAYNEPESPFFGSHPVMFVHDEIIAEVPSDSIHEHATEMARIMCESMQSVTPNVLITASPAAMSRWYKEASPVWIKDRLSLWEPKR
jgi:hypothetical protein